MAKKPSSPGRIARLRQNPGTRAALDDKFLTSGQRQQRALNTRLNAPVTPGSSMTNRDLARSRNASLQVAYGPQEQALGREATGQQQQGKDQQSWYDQYVNDLRTHAQNVATYNKGATDATTALTANVGNLKSDVTGAGGGVQQDTQNASAIRQALTASFGAQQAGQGAAGNTYADTLANVVGPGQKLTALAQTGRNTDAIRQKQTDLAGQKGAAGQKFDADTIASEFKNVLANQALNLNTVKAATTAKAASSTRQETRRHNQAQETTAKTRVDAQGKSVYTSGPFSGMTKAEVGALSPQERQAKSDAYAKTKGPGKGAVTQAADDFYKKYGVKPATQPAVVRAQGSLGKAKSWVKTVRASNPGMSRAELAQLLVRGQPADKKGGSPAIPAQDELWVSAALDLAFLGGRISNGTADKLHKAGYSVKGLGLGSKVTPDSAIREVKGLIGGLPR